MNKVESVSYKWENNKYRFRFRIISVTRNGKTTLYLLKVTTTFSIVEGEKYAVIKPEIRKIKEYRFK